MLAQGQRKVGEMCDTQKKQLEEHITTNYGRLNDNRSKLNWV